MSSSVLVDNDVVLKTCCYQSTAELREMAVASTAQVYALGVARFVVQKAIQKSRRILQKPSAKDHLAYFLEWATLIEPSGEELSLAAQFESEAQAVGLELDCGESQLLAVLILRNADVLLTGDKRAIKAMEDLVKSMGYEERVSQHVACLEQLMLTFIRHHGVGTFQERVCLEAGLDIGMSICFRCDSRDSDPEAIQQSILSYLRDLQKQAKCVLSQSEVLPFAIS